jgi:hypothetical protein
MANKETAKNILRTKFSHRLGNSNNIDKILQDLANLNKIN